MIKGHLRLRSLFAVKLLFYFNYFFVLFLSLPISEVLHPWELWHFIGTLAGCEPPLAPPPPTSTTQFHIFTLQNHLILPITWLSDRMPLTLVVSGLENIDKILLWRYFCCFFQFIWFFLEDPIKLHQILLEAVDCGPFNVSSQMFCGIYVWTLKMAILYLISL